MFNIYCWFFVKVHEEQYVKGAPFKDSHFFRSERVLSSNSAEDLQEDESNISAVGNSFDVLDDVGMSR